MLYWRAETIRNRHKMTDNKMLCKTCYELTDLPTSLHEKNTIFKVSYSSYLSFQATSIEQCKTIAAPLFYSSSFDILPNHKPGLFFPVHKLHFVCSIIHRLPGFHDFYTWTKQLLNFLQRRLKQNENHSCSVIHLMQHSSAAIEKLWGKLTCSGVLPLCLCNTAMELMCFS